MYHVRFLRKSNTTFMPYPANKASPDFLRPLPVGQGITHYQNPIRIVPTLADHFRQNLPLCSGNAMNCSKKCAMFRLCTISRNSASGVPRQYKGAILIIS